MKKFIFNSFAVLFFLILFSFIFSQKSIAATCIFTLAPTTITDKTQSIAVNVTSSDLAPLHSYKITIAGGNACYHGYCPNRTAQLAGGSLSVKFDLPSTLSNGNYTIGATDTQGGASVCSSSFLIGPSSAGGNSCNLVPVKPDPFNPKPSDYIAFKITGGAASGNSDDQLHTYIKVNNNDGAGVWDGCIKKSDFISSNGFGFGYLTSGSYYIQVNDGCTPAHIFENQACYAKFSVDPTGGGLGGSGNPQDPIPPGPCSAGANSKGSCSKVDTGLGISIGTDPQSLIQTLFGLILSFSGGIALLLIIISGYKMLASQGNPEALKGAREQLTAAIVGLLFVILALVILQVIGVDILHIPGFGPSASGGGGGGRLIPI